jgi:hypothetical protein
MNLLGAQQVISQCAQPLSQCGISISQTQSCVHQRSSPNLVCIKGPRRSAAGHSRVCRYHERANVVFLGLRVRTIFQLLRNSKPLICIYNMLQHATTVDSPQSNVCFGEIP